ncbi:hypothetical protein ACHWQZ_G017936 [Mnemiopsis leidyi]
MVVATLKNSPSPSQQLADNWENRSREATSWKTTFWLACCHHILELAVGAAFTELFGDTKSPEVTLFKTLKTSWDSLDLSSIRLPDIPPSFRTEKDELLNFVNTFLELDNLVKLPRGDYKEFLELSKIFLGGSIEQKKGYTYSHLRNGLSSQKNWTTNSWWDRNLQTDISLYKSLLKFVNELLDLLPNLIPTLQGTRSPFKNWSK